jgi:four helix bundle protein
MQRGPIIDKSINFSVLIYQYTRLLEDKRQFVLSNQLLKSGTSIGANVFEAQFSESRTDFVHKMKIAQKEANETHYWLTLCEKMGQPEIDQEILKELHEIMLILSKIIFTGKKNLKDVSNKK